MEATSYGSNKSFAETYLVYKGAPVNAFTTNITVIFETLNPEVSGWEFGLTFSDALSAIYFVFLYFSYGHDLN